MGLVNASSSATSAAPRAPRARRLFIDWARGVAVLCMIEHHAFDAWMPDSFHGSAPDRLFRYLGGVAAPTFLFLAGLAMALMMEGGLARGQTRSQAMWVAVRRGLWIFLAAHLFRFQQWILWWGAAPWTDLVRIDVLNCIGLALVFTALVWWLGPTRLWRGGLLGLACAAVVLAAPLVWAADLSHLPVLLVDYLKGTPPRALFPLFPWVAFAFAGAIPGLLLARTREAKDPDEAERIFMLRATAACLGLWVVTRVVDHLPFTLYANLEWWRTSPAYFVLRSCSELWLLTACFVVERAFRPFWASRKAPGPLLLLGRHSLLIYWVHIEIVYGRWFWGVRGKMSLAVAGAWVVAVMAAMVLLAWAVERGEEWWAGRAQLRARVQA